MKRSHDEPVPCEHAQDTPLDAHAGTRPQAGDCRAELAKARRLLHDEVLRRREAEEALERRTAQLRATALELARAEHGERQRLSGVLHDHLQQLLAGVKHKVARMDRPLNGQERHEGIQEVADILDEAIAQTRSLAVELSPPVTFDGGLVPALEWLGRWMRQKHGLTVRVTAADEGPVAGDGEPLRMLFNVVRELLFNVTKHAQVTVAIVQVQRVGDQIRIVVEDKGTGTAAFQSNTMGAADVGLGLFNIRKRLDLVGGRFEIDSAPGKGSRFTLEAPWDQAHRGRRGVARCERAACATTVSWRKRT